MLKCSFSPFFLNYKPLISSAFWQNLYLFSEDDEVANEEEEEDQESDVRAESETEGEGPAAENETEDVDTSDSNWFSDSEWVRNQLEYRTNNNSDVFLLWNFATKNIVFYWIYQTLLRDFEVVTSQNFIHPSISSYKVWIIFCFHKNFFLNWFIVQRFFNEFSQQSGMYVPILYFS